MSFRNVYCWTTKGDYLKKNSLKLDLNALTCKIQFTMNEFLFFFSCQWLDRPDLCHLKHLHNNIRALIDLQISAIQQVATHNCSPNSLRYILYMYGCVSLCVFKQSIRRTEVSTPYWCVGIYLNDPYINMWYKRLLGISVVTIFVVVKEKHCDLFTKQSNM